jgi:hypothetical protein
MQGRSAEQARIYPVRGVLRSEYGVVTERDILVYSTGLAAFQRFRRPPGVTIGKGDVFGFDRASDEALIAILAGFEPLPFEQELSDSATVRLLVDRLGALRGDEPVSSVDALIRIAQLAKAPEVQSALRHAFSRAPRADAKLRILAGAFAQDEVHWTRALAELLSLARGSPAEATTVGAVERLGLAGMVATPMALFRLAEARARS